MIAAASNGIDRNVLVPRARSRIAVLRREHALWATALAEAFDAACDQLDGKRAMSQKKLRQAAGLLDSAGMNLFATAARHHLVAMLGDGNLQIDSKWYSLGVANGNRMAEMLLPGFNHEQ